MNFVAAHNLVCPIDGEKLEPQAMQYNCVNGHVFDIAKQGYVNLLPVQHKRSKHPGDSKAMVLARKQFLDTGIYQAIAIKLIDIVQQQLKEQGAYCLLDAGCGEAYYSDAVFKSLISNEEPSAFSFIGLDISKDAIIQATKRNKQINWIVASNRQLPVESESVDIILCLFGFLSIEGFSKVLKPGGKIIFVDPGLNHLKELREVIYPRLKKAESSTLLKMEIPGFLLNSSETLSFKEKISDVDTIKNLLVMTPHFYRASKEGRQAADELTELDLTADVVFRVFEKNKKMSS
jgi:23S rRNA (guanine745-N1)-methyltransferase